MQRKGGGSIQLFLRVFCLGARTEKWSKERQAALATKSAAPAAGRSRLDERLGVGEGIARSSWPKCSQAGRRLGAEAPAKIQGVTLMRPIHSNL